MRRTIKSIVKDLDSNRKVSRRKSRKLPSERFYYNLEDALWTMIRVLNNRNSEQRNKRIAISNFQVNAVTAIEVFFKSIISTNKNWSPNGIEELLKENITLGEAYKILKKHKLTPQFIIAETFSFSDFWSMGTYMKKLLNTEIDFFIEFETHTFGQYNWESKKGESKTFIALFPNWRREIQSLYTERNRFIHEGVISKKSVDDLAPLYNVLEKFSQILSVYFAERYRLTI